MMLKTRRLRLVPRVVVDLNRLLLHLHNSTRMTSSGSHFLLLLLHLVVRRDLRLILRQVLALVRGEVLYYHNLVAATGRDDARGRTTMTLLLLLLRLLGSCS